ASPEAFKADTDTAQTAQMLLSNGLTAAEFDRLPLVAYGSGHHYMGGFYRDGVIALDRADPVFDRYRALLIAAHGEKKTAEILAVDRFNNLIWPNISVNSRFAVLRHVQPIAVDRTIITSQCFRLDGAPPEMLDLTLQFLNTASSASSMVASDDLEIFERCQRGLNDATHEWIDLRRGVLAETRRSDGAIQSSGANELPIRHQFAAWQEHMLKDPALKDQARRDT
ncbi:MAG: SRPBCC family protein, partial [Burkholderiales bacterium]